MGNRGPSPSPSKRSNRLQAVALRSVATVAAVLALGGVQFLLAPSTVKTAGFDPTADDWVVSQYQAVVVSFYAWVVAIVIAYWLLTATLGGGQFLKVRSANVALGLSGLMFAVAMAILSVVPTPETLFEVACPLLGLPDAMPPLPAGAYSFDGQTSCEAFANGAAPTVLLGLPSILLLTSAILRIVLSRRPVRAQ
jgi:hypothetical protein